MSETPEERERRRMTRPQTPAALRRYVAEFLGLNVPARAVCPGHDAPLAYLWSAFAHDTFGARGRRNADCIVWANRGGGKTQLGAVATLLDLVFKPGCQVRILGGSGEQSRRMYEYLGGFFQGGFKGDLAARAICYKHGCTRLADDRGSDVLGAVWAPGPAQHPPGCGVALAFPPPIRPPVAASSREFSENAHQAYLRKKEFEA